MSIVYQHIRRDNCRVFYIGKGCNIARSKSKQHRNTHWHNIVNKYGYDIEILHTGLTNTEAETIEKDLISKYGRIDLNTGLLVNMTSGGTGCKDYFKAEIVTSIQSEQQHTKPKLKPITVEQMTINVIELRNNLPQWWHNRLTTTTIKIHFPIRS